MLAQTLLLVHLIPEATNISRLPKALNAKIGFDCF
jgi:hypothetical protein